jgi:hypothetical protein
MSTLEESIASARQQWTAVFIAETAKDLFVGMVMAEGPQTPEEVNDCAEMSKCMAVALAVKLGLIEGKDDERPGHDD